MKSLSNKIFGPQDSLSREELQAYLDGKLSGEAKHRVEEKLASGSYESEALEGLEQDPGALEMLPLKPGFLQAENSSGASSSVYKTLFWISTAVAVLAIVILFMQAPESSLEKPQIIVASDQVQSTPIAETEKEERLIEIENAQPIASAEQITYTKAVKAQPKTLPADEVKIQPANPVQPEEVVEHIPAHTPELIENNPIDPVVISNVKFTYLHDLKVIDYSELYTEGIKKQEINLSGTPANVAQKGEKDELEWEIRTVRIPYETYLKETLGEFKDGRFKNALKQFNIILEHYPDDLNAHFYGGLCYFNLGKFERAISYLDKCINNAFNTFSEEAEWYKAKSLIKLNRKEDAKTLLQNIVNAKGFYARQAQTMLADL
jgi:tetratricopeptide (TPR) repeat protein